MGGRRQRATKGQAAESTPASGPRRLLTEKQAADYLATTAGSLRTDRYAANLGVPWIRFGRRGVRYSIADLDAYIASRTVRCAGGEL